MPNVQRLLCVSAVCLVIVSLIGCGDSDLTSVTGTVTVDGQPAAGHRLEFAPSSLELGAGRAIVDEEGKYELVTSRTIKGVKPGLYRVSVLGPVELAIRDGERPPAGAVRIPAKYHGRKTTLSADVKPGENTFDFEVTTGPDAGR